MWLDDSKVLEELLNRMKKIEGQARGIQRMLEEGRDCEEIVLQLAAMRAAIGKVAMAVIGGYLEQCLLNRKDMPLSEAVEKAKQIILKFS